jgi:hypothetical protein
MPKTAEGAVYAAAAAGGPRHEVGERVTPDAYRIVDWTRFETAPSAMDVERLLRSVARDGARLAILVSTPKVLSAANAFAERAELQGAQVRVFVGATEAVAWLYRDLPAENLTHEWPAGTSR